MGESGKARLVQFDIPVKIRLAGLWASAMFCYAYGDLIGLYLPGRIDAVAQGDLGPLGVANPGLLTGIAAVMAVPAVLVALSLHLPARANRAVNMLFGAIYTLMMAGTMFTAPPYYMLQGAIEILLTGAVVWQAARWPREQTQPVR